MEKRIKDKKIWIVAPYTTQDDIGQEIEETLPLTDSPMWAYYRQLSMTEAFGAAAINADVEVLFQINWRDDVSTYMSVEYKGKVYNIKQIDTYEGNKTDLKLLCKHDTNARPVMSI